MTLASIIVPAFNVARTISETLDALLAQSYSDFEVIIVDDGSTDETPRIAAEFARHPRVRMVRQANRGLAGARNTGIAASRGKIIGFCDADDLWEPEKLAVHMAHLNANPDVGISYSGSALINDAGDLLRQAQRPRLHNVDAALIFKRNPIGNGSAVVLRRDVLEAIAWRPRHEQVRDWYFDETFRQSEDIECWLRIALSTEWKFEGVEGLLTRYRINAGGLSAATDRQLAAWERMVIKLTPLNPAFFLVNTGDARAYQLRYLNRRAISDLDAIRAVALSRAWMAQSRAPLFEEPAKSVVTLAATAGLSVFGAAVIRRIMAFGQRRQDTAALS